MRRKSLKLGIRKVHPQEGISELEFGYKQVIGNVRLR